MAALKAGKCLRQIAEPAAQVLERHNTCGYHWKSALLDGRTLEHVEDGMGWYPALPSFDEETNTRKLYESIWDGSLLRQR